MKQSVVLTQLFLKLTDELWSHARHAGASGERRHTISSAALTIRFCSRGSQGFVCARIGHVFMVDQIAACVQEQEGVRLRVVTYDALRSKVRESGPDANDHSRHGAPILG